MPKKRRTLRIKDFKTFEAAIWAATDPYAITLIREERAWRKAIREQNPGFRAPLPTRPHTPKKEDLLVFLFQQFNEIVTSFDSLNNIPFYVKHLPRALSKRVTRVTWIHYHFENYLHELYIFEERVRALLTSLCRKYKKVAYSKQMSDESETLKTRLRAITETLRENRRGHVHERRFDDVHLTQLEAVHLLLRAKKASPKDYLHWFLDARAEKVFDMTYQNEELKKWLNECGRVLGKLLFEKGGEFRFPN
jgi:hypothetical protein